MMEFGLYLLYAYVQAVLFVRVSPRLRQDYRAAHVAVWMLFAPVLTVGLLLATVWYVTEWLAKGGREGL